MRRSFFFIVTLSFAFVCGLAASESKAEDPKAERPTWEGGDFWVYEGKTEGQLRPTTEELKVLERTPFREKEVYVVQTGLMKAYYDQDLNYMATFVAEKPAASVEPAVAFFNWPLQVGKQWSQKAEYWDARKGDNSVQQVDSLFKVTGYEAVTVPAGTFHAFKLKRTSRVDQGFDEYWYAPEVKNIVKRISLIPSGERQTKVTFELKGYKAGERR